MQSGSVFYVAVDIGGTFTDVVAVDPATGRYDTVKVSTTPHRLVDGVHAGTVAALERAGAASDGQMKMVTRVAIAVVLAGK